MADVPMDCDELRLDAIVKAMARYLSQGLRLPDCSLECDEFHWRRDAAAIAAEASHAKSVVKTLFDEGLYLPNTEQLDALSRLEVVAQKAQVADGIALTLLDACHWPCPALEPDGDDGVLKTTSWTDGPTPPGDGESVQLAPYTALWPYYNFTKLRFEAQPTVVVGGVGKRLLDSIRALAVSWLLSCDRVMSYAHDEFTTVPSADMMDLVHRFSGDIARRVTLHNRPDPSGLVDHLSPAFLQSRNEMEFARDRAEADVQVRNDVAALRALHVIARDGRSEVVADVLRHQLPLLRIVIHTPPSELHLAGLRAKNMNLSLLAPVCDVTVPLAARLNIAEQWCSCHGVWAKQAVEEALHRLETKTTVDVSFVSVATKAGHRSQPLLPIMPWAPWASRWHVLSTSNMRLGLPSAESRRLVRLTSFVWQLVGDGAFESGRVSCDILAPVAMEVMQVARLAREIIDQERKHRSVGIRMLALSEAISDRQSDVAESLNKCQCELSAFSLCEIESVFSPRLCTLPCVIKQLETLTRAHMSNVTTPVVPGMNRLHRTPHFAAVCCTFVLNTAFHVHSTNTAHTPAQVATPAK